MSDIRFEWDHEKNIINKRKHGIDFDEAKTVFYDEYARIISARKATNRERLKYSERLS